MEAGKLDRMITLQSYAPVRLGTGEELAGYVDWLTVWAQKEEGLSARDNERFEAAQLVADANVTFTMRWRTGLDYRMRIVCEGNLFDIQSIAEIPRRKGWKIVALKKDSDQTAANLPGGQVPQNGIVPIQYADYTVQPGNRIIPFDCSLQDCICYLPSAVGNTLAYQVARIDNTEGRSLLIQPITPGNEAQINQGDALGLYSQGAFTLQANGEIYLLTAY